MPGLAVVASLGGTGRLGKRVSSSIRAVIVDDEPLARRGLELRLRGHADVEVVAQCTHGEEAIATVSALHPDLLFLDVQMPGLDGFQTLEAMPAKDRPLTVFVTAFDHFAVRAFEACALDYLLKPVEDERLTETLARVRDALGERGVESQREKLLVLLRQVSGKPDLQLEDVLAEDMPDALREHDILSIRDGGKIVRVPIDHIRWIEAAGDYMCVHADDDTHILRATLKQMEEQLDARIFHRIHRSTIVNVKRVKSLRPHINGEYFLKLDSGHEVKLSRSYRDKLEFLR
ncbi:MAG: response regulator transcription factor [Xanthomonadales bacterium]|nr:response regulator transcription factor [Xanthomonadales bacterium]